MVIKVLFCRFGGDMDVGPFVDMAYRNLVSFMRNISMDVQWDFMRAWARGLNLEKVSSSDKMVST